MVNAHRILFSLLLAIAPTAWALHPHQLGVIINENDPESVHTAVRYAGWRGIPLENLAYVRLPDEAHRPEAEITPEQFTQHIWEPAWQQLREQGTAPHLLAWVYSTGFPAAIRTKPKISLHGLTFSRNKLPDLERVKSGRLASPLFGGPAQPGGPQRPPLGFDRLPTILQQQDPPVDMPLPAMSLGFDGARGLPAEVTRKHLEALARSDGKGFEGTFFFLAHDDVRSRARTWQFKQVVRELTERGHAAEIVPKLPPPRTPVAGIMAGSPTVRPTYHQVDQGAFADHLTSFAAVFSRGANQNKLTEWLRVGFAASAGTVTEPFAIWTKFPHARTQVLLADGLCMIEALYQGTACPWQTLFVGDPLAAPGARTFRPGILDTHMADRWQWHISHPVETNLLVQTLINGRVASRWQTQDTITVPRTAVPDGTFVMRMVGSRPDTVGTGGWREAALTGSNPGPDIVIPQTVRWPQSFEVEPVTSASSTDSWQLYHGGRVLAAEQQPSGGWRLDPRALHLPPGPITLHAAYRRDGVQVPGPRHTVLLDNTNSPPQLTVLPRTRTDDGVYLPFRVKDSDGDTVTTQLYVDLLSEASVETATPEKVKRSRDRLTLTDSPPEGTSLSWTLNANPDASWQRLLLQWRWLNTADIPWRQQLYLVFNRTDIDSFCYIGFNGVEGAWEMGRMEAGKKRSAVRIGRAILLSEVTRMECLADEAGLELRVNGAFVGRWPDGPEPIGPVELLKKGYAHIELQEVAARPNTMNPTPGRGWTFPANLWRVDLAMQASDPVDHSWTKVPADQ